MMIKISSLLLILRTLSIALCGTFYIFKSYDGLKLVFFFLTLNLEHPNNHLSNEKQSLGTTKGILLPNLKKIREGLGQRSLPGKSQAQRIETIGIVTENDGMMEFLLHFNRFITNFTLQTLFNSSSAENLKLLTRSIQTWKEYLLVSRNIFFVIFGPSLRVSWLQTLPPSRDALFFINT